MGGVGIALLFGGAVRVTGSPVGDTSLYVVGGLLVLAATGLPQRFWAWAVQSFDRHVQTARDDHVVIAAIRLCRNAATDLSALPIRDTEEMSLAAFFSRGKRGPSEAIDLYRTLHQAATVNAVRLALRAEAKDGGALQLAEKASSDADLLTLKAELFRMALELGQEAQLGVQAYDSAAGQIRR